MSLAMNKVLLPRPSAAAACKVVLPLRPSGRRVILRISASAADAAIHTHSLHNAHTWEEVCNIRRRLVLLGFAAAVVPFPLQRARAEESATAEYKKFVGFAVPPDTYLGYDDGMKLPPKYSFEYPGEYKVHKPTKTEKSTMGMDGCVIHTQDKDVKAFVISLSGPDYRGAQLNPDKHKQLLAMATSDYDMREAISSASSIEARERKLPGSSTKVYDYEIKSEEGHWLSTMGVGPDGTMFALMIVSPNNMWGRVEGDMRHLQSTFQLL